MTIVGRLGRDPELKQSAKGSDYAWFTLASMRKERHPETKEYESVWYSVTVLNPHEARKVDEWLSQGSKVEVSGNLGHPTIYGDGRVSLPLAAVQVTFLGREDAGEVSDVVREPAGAPVEEAEKDEIPF